MIRASGASVLIGASLLCIALQEMVGCTFRSKRMAWRVTHEINVAHIYGQGS